MKSSRSFSGGRSVVLGLFTLGCLVGSLGWAQKPSPSPTPSREELVKRASGWARPAEATPKRTPEARATLKPAEKEALEPKAALPPAGEKPAALEKPSAATAKPFLNPILRASDFPTTRAIEEPKQKPLPGTVLRLQTPTPAEVYVPSGFKPAGTTIDLVVHFHGAPWIVEQNFEESGVNAALLVINPGGRGSQYASLFSNPDVFDYMLDVAIQKLRNEKVAPSGAEWGRMSLSAFSAGYGAIRELLYTAEYFNRVEAIALADALHANFADDSSTNTRAIDAEQMRPFAEFAKLAAEGKKTLLLSRSSVIPGNYSGTPETAAYLIQQVGGREEAVKPPQKGPNDLVVIARFDKGNFHVRGYAGIGAADHMQHLFSIAALFRQLPLNKKN